MPLKTNPQELQRLALFELRTTCQVPPRTTEEAHVAESSFPPLLLRARRAPIHLRPSQSSSHTLTPAQTCRRSRRHEPRPPVQRRSRLGSHVSFPHVVCDLPALATLWIAEATSSRQFHH